MATGAQEEAIEMSTTDRDEPKHDGGPPSKKRKLQETADEGDREASMQAILLRTITSMSSETEREMAAEDYAVESLDVELRRFTAHMDRLLPLLRIFKDALQVGAGYTITLDILADLEKVSRNLTGLAGLLQDVIREEKQIGSAAFADLVAKTTPGQQRTEMDEDVDQSDVGSVESGSLDQTCAAECVEERHGTGGALGDAEGSSG